MSFVTSRQEALDKLAQFNEQYIQDYSAKRNFDLGPSERNNVSCLSPYITHRLITEYEVVKKVLAKHSFAKVDKYIQEVFWRVYWKGWLELRPKVWEDFLKDLKHLTLDQNYELAIQGKTDITCFNDWVQELKSSNYLHNHTRMWFASIWIFTLKLPWQLGAEFFMKHLADGDAASNTLSWRWVAGLQTKGKHYVAQAWNVAKFTNDRYQNVKLNEQATPIEDDRIYSIKKKEMNSNPKGEHLLFFENDLNLETIKLKDYKSLNCLILPNEQRKIKLAQNVLSYKEKVIADQIARLNKDVRKLRAEELDELVQSKEGLDVIYPNIGENLTYLQSIESKYSIKLNYIERSEDAYCHQFSTKGFFNFKENIPKIIAHLKLS
jgi:deoxyribodipyrimidine photo-lyase